MVFTYNELSLHTWSCCINEECLSVTSAVQPAPGGGVAGVAAATPGAEVVPDPEVATTTAARGLAPTPDPGPSPSPEAQGGANPSLPLGRGPARGPSRGAELRLPTGDPNPGPDPSPRVGLNLQRTTKQSLNHLDTIRRYSGEKGGLY